MRKLEFTAEDFAAINILKSTCVASANAAQAKFDKWLSEQPVVYGCKSTHGHPWCETQFESQTHRAIICCIEELPKKECRHEPDHTKFMDIDVFSSTCKNCGKKLKAKWEVVESGEW